MKIWITKYILTKGILVEEAELTEFSNMVKTAGRYAQFYHKGEWYTTEEEAKLRALEIIGAKLKSLEKQRKKLVELMKKIGG
jgi:hypothetical protein